MGHYDQLEEEYAHQKSELRTLQDVSEERTRQVEGDIRDFQEQADKVLVSHQDLMSDINHTFDQETAELEHKYGPSIQDLSNQLLELETGINSNVESIKLMKDRLFDLKDNLKNIIVEHATKVAKEESAALDLQEKTLSQKLEDETRLAGELKQKAEVTEKVIQTVHNKFSDQMSKVEKVMSVLKKSKEKITSELDMALSEKNQLSVLNSHREEAYYELLEETKMLKSVLDETSECMAMYKQYINLRNQNSSANIPFTHNKLLNQIIGVDNILEQELEDNKQLLSKLRQQEDYLNQRHSESAHALGEMRLQYNRVIDGVKKLPYEVNKVFALVTPPTS